MTAAGGLARYDKGVQTMKCCLQAVVALLADFTLAPPGWMLADDVEPSNEGRTVICRQFERRLSAAMTATRT